MSNSTELWISKSSACFVNGTEEAHSAKIFRSIFALSGRSSSNKCGVSDVVCDIMKAVLPLELGSDLLSRRKETRILKVVEKQMKWG
jgi:hypothetical protein